MDTKIVTLLLALVLIQNVSATLSPDILQCIEKEKVSQSEVLAYGRDGNLNLVKSNPNLKCFSACLMETAELLDGCNLLYVEAMLKGHVRMDNEENIMLDFCKDKVKSSERCECGYELFKCLRQYNMAENKQNTV